MIPTRLSHEAEARKHSGAFVDLYGELLMKGDPLADAFAADVERLGHKTAMTMLETALDRGIGAVAHPPESLVRLFAQLDDVPPWVDWDRMERGARAYQRTGMAGSMTLSAVSLMNGYHSSAAIKPLLFTGQLDKMARRRLAETGKFIAETIQVDGLRRFSQGFKSTVKVRIVHAFVRRMLQHSDRWDSDAWGLPINQADMGATNLSFSIALIHGVRTIGLKYTREDADAIIHLWRYSGYLSGVDLALLATNEEEAWYRAEVIDLMQPDFDEGSLVLAEALRSATQERTDDPVRRAVMPYVMGFHDGLTRVVIGDEKADHLKTPHKEWARVVRGMSHVIGAIESVRERIPLATELAERLGNRAWLTVVAMELGDKAATFEPPREVPFAHRFRRKKTAETHAA